MIYVHVSNTYRSKLRAGIQRLVVSVCNRLIEDPRFKFIAFDHVREAFFLFYDCTDFSRAIYDEKFKRIAFDLDELRRGDVFFEIDAAWGDGIARTDFYRRLKSQGVIIVGMHYDAVPILFSAYAHPDTVLNYLEYFVDLTTSADYILTISESVERDLQSLSVKYNGFRVISKVLPLGSDFHVETDELASGVEDARLAAVLSSSRPFFLSVGTIEPRKNHSLLLQAFERLPGQDAALVLVGRQGWHTEEFVGRLVTHPDYRKRIFWFGDLDDAALALLYRRCHASILVSHYEGYGLPAAEGLALGCPTIVSGGGALKDIVGRHGVLVPSGDPDALASVLERTLHDPAYHASLKNHARSYRPTNWAETAYQIASFADDIVDGAICEFDAPLRQAVYLSVNPAKLVQSLNSIKEHLPFIDRVVVLTRLKHEKAVSEATHAGFANAIVLCDEHLFDQQEHAIEDHQARNTLLRQKLYRQPCIDPNFVALDDDYIALQRVDPAYFIDRGVHQGYYFLTDIGFWAGAFPAKTSYDKGLINTWMLLRRLGYGRMAFSSHMPQVINKRLAKLIFDRFVGVKAMSAYDEWSLYFNIAMHLYPKRFATKAYETLDWPMDPCDWLPEVVPGRFQFENRHAGVTRVTSPSTRDDDASGYEDREAYLRKLRHARAVELGENGAQTTPIILTATAADALSLECARTLLAGRSNLRRVLIDDNAALAAPAKLTMNVLTQSGKTVRHAAMTLGDARWLPLYPPDEEGPYWMVFHMTRGREEIASLAVEVTFSSEPGPQL